MKRVYLLRHAKSSWKDRPLADRDRRLAGRGGGPRARLPIISGRRGFGPSSCCAHLRGGPGRHSSVSRGALGDEVEVVFEEGLYGASEAGLLPLLRVLPREVGSVLVIGRNPGLGGLALALASEGTELARMREKYPTAALPRLTCRQTAGARSRGAAASSSPTCDHGTCTRVRVRPASATGKPDRGAPRERRPSGPPRGHRASGERDG